MKANKTRFQALLRGSAGGTKWLNREDLDSGLGRKQANDALAFKRGLSTVLGVEPAPDDEFASFSVLDTHTGVKFEAYCGPSGPAYGGAFSTFILEPGQRPRLPEEILAMLRVFDATVGATIIEEE